MKKSTIAEIERLAQKIPPKDIYYSALFTICRKGNGFEIEEIVSNDFGHMPEALKGDEQYLIGHYTYEFDTIQESVAFIDKRRYEYHGAMPCLAMLGTLTQAEVNEIQTLKKMLYVNTKYLAFLFGVVVKEEYETRVID